MQGDNQQKMQLRVDSQPEIESRIKSLDELSELVENARARAETIVTTNGAFDILHFGHMVTLYESKRLGDLLIVGVNSDESVRSYKSPDRPINPQEMRIRAVAAVGCVDYVFLFDEDTPISWIEQLRPDIHTTGASYGEHPIEREAVENCGGRIHLVPMLENLSTSAIIGRILRVYGPKDD